MLAAHGRQDGLIVDAGVGHQHAERLEGGNRARFETGHGLGLLQALVRVEVETARIGDGGNAHAALRLGQLGQLLEPHNAGFAQTLGVGHDVGLAHRHEIGRVEEIADRDLMLDGPLAGGAFLPRQHGVFFIRETHGPSAAHFFSGGSAAMAALRTGVMRAISLSTSFCRPAGPRSSLAGAVEPSST